LFFFFFKQKTAYEIQWCDWSSDVCSSDPLAIPVQDAASFGGPATIAMNCHIYNGGIGHIVLTATKVTAIH